MLFAIAYVGDRRPLYPRQPKLRPLVYSLALAVYCSSWTFYGAVGTAARSGLSYLPIYLGPLVLFGFGLLERLVLVARERNITSIADFIAARFGKSHGLAALVAIIAVVAIIPDIALPCKAVAMSFSVLGTDSSAWWFGDSALWCAALLAVFAILFGTRNIDATEHHHGMMLAVAVESLVKLLAFVAIGIYAYLHGPGIVETMRAPIMQVEKGSMPPGFVAQTLLAFCAMFCLPRQFQIGVVECEDPRDLRKARVLFPIYMILISVAVLPIVSAGMHLPQVTQGHVYAWVLNLPIALGDSGMALLAFVGGFSAATGMVIVAAVALATMISNDLVMPTLLRIRRLDLEQRGDLSHIVLFVRRVAIVALAGLAYIYYRIIADAENLAATGLLSFAAVAQFAPAIVSALYWRGASRVGVYVGLLAGFVVWAYTLLLPAMTRAGWVHPRWIDEGPVGIGWLKATDAFHLAGWESVTHGTFWSLLFNVGCLVFISLRFRPSVAERLHAALFVDPFVRSATGAGDWRGRVTVRDLGTIAGRIVGDRVTVRAFNEYG